jgi:hypothetical protein
MYTGIHIFIFIVCKSHFNLSFMHDDLLKLNNKLTMDLRCELIAKFLVVRACIFTLYCFITFGFKF